MATKSKPWTPEPGTRCRVVSPMSYGTRLEPGAVVVVGSVFGRGRNRQVRYTVEGEAAEFRRYTRLVWFRVKCVEA